MILVVSSVTTLQSQFAASVGQITIADVVDHAVTLSSQSARDYACTAGSVVPRGNLQHTDFWGQPRQAPAPVKRLAALGVGVATILIDLLRDRVTL